MCNYVSKQSVTEFKDHFYCKCMYMCFIHSYALALLIFWSHSVTSGGSDSTANKLKPGLIHIGLKPPDTGGRRKGSPRCRMFISLDPRHTEDNLRKSWGAITHNASGSETASNPPVVSWWTLPHTAQIQMWCWCEVFGWWHLENLLSDWCGSVRSTRQTHSAACLHTLHNVTQPQWNMMFRLWFVPLSWGLSPPPPVCLSVCL